MTPLRSRLWVSVQSRMEKNVSFVRLKVNRLSSLTRSRLGTSRRRPRPIACLHGVAVMGLLLLSWWIWSVHLARGRPGGRFHVGSWSRPTTRARLGVAWHGERERYTGDLDTSEYCIPTSRNLVRHRCKTVTDKIMLPDSVDPSLTLHVN